jgi:hypothetical protein
MGRPRPFFARRPGLVPILPPGAAPPFRRVAALTWYADSTASGARAGAHAHIELCVTWHGSRLSENALRAVAHARTAGSRA